MACAKCQARKAAAKNAALKAWRTAKAQIVAPWKPKADKREAK